MSNHSYPYRIPLASGAIVVVAPLSSDDEPSDEGQTIKRSKREIQRERWRAMIREELQQPNLEFRYNELGAPYIVDSPLHIGVSHSRKLVAIIISEKRCSVDIEELERNFAAIKERYISPPEAKIEVPHSEALIWSAKETLYKYADRKELCLIEDLKIHAITEKSIKGSIEPCHITLDMPFLIFDGHVVVFFS